MARPLRQPDQRSCGAAVLVVAEALRRPGYARALVTGGREVFEREVLAMHRRSTGPVDVTGRLQVPWTRLLGTPPWAVARQCAARSGVPHRVRVVWPWRRAGRWQELTSALEAGSAVPVYLGSRALPRHVVLALPGPPSPPGVSVRVYDPGPGRPVPLTREEWTAGSTRAGWPVPWFTVLPVPPRPARRTRA